MRRCVFGLWTIASAVASSTSKSNLLQSVSGGATQIAHSTFPNSQEGLARDVQTDEVIFITKRDGRLEPLDGNKVRFDTIFCEGGGVFSMDSLWCLIELVMLA